MSPAIPVPSAAPWPRATGKLDSPAGRWHARLSRQRLAANACDATYLCPGPNRLRRHVQVGTLWGACAARALATPLTMSLDAVLGTGRLHHTVRAQHAGAWHHSEAHPCSSGLLLRAAWGLGDAVGYGTAAATAMWLPLEAARMATAGLKAGITGVGMAVGALWGVAAGLTAELFERTPLERLRPWRALRDTVRAHLHAHRMTEAHTQAVGLPVGRCTEFPVPTAQAFEAVFGEPVTRGALIAKYRPLLPHAHWNVTATQLPVGEGVPPCVMYLLTAFDHRGKLIAQLTRTAVRQSDDAIELHSSDLFVARRYRGRGFTARCEELEAHWLRARSSHPRTRLSLGGGWAPNPLREDSIEYSGYYVHAAHGYQFADEAGLTPAELSMWNTYGPRTPGEPEDSERGDRTLMAERFTRLLDRCEGWLTVDGAPATRADCIALRQDIERCVHPWEFAEVGTQARLRLGEEPVAVALMTAPEMSYWRGVRFVNSAEDRDEQAVREQSAVAFQRSTQRELERSEQRARFRGDDLSARLNHVSWKQRLTAYKDLRREGDRGWERALTRRLAKSSPLERAKISEALAAIRGERLMDGLSERAERPTLSAERAQFLVDQRNTLQHG